jgi:hypothetical protein
LYPQFHRITRRLLTGIFGNAATTRLRLPPRFMVEISLH